MTDCKANLPALALWHLKTYLLKAAFNIPPLAANSSDSDSFMWPMTLYTCFTYLLPYTSTCCRVCSLRVSCRQLGFPDAVTWSSTPTNQRISLSRRRRRVGLDGVTCVGNETSLMTQCRYSSSSWLHTDNDSCSHLVFVQCLCVDCNDYSAYMSTQQYNAVNRDK